MRRLIISISLLSMLFMAAPQPALAYGFFKNDCDSETSSTTVCGKEGDNTANPLTGCSAPDASGNETGCGTGLLMKIVNIIAYVAGAAAIIIIIVGAIRLIASGSDVSVGNRIDDDVLNARRSITQALIGLAVIVLAKTIITYVITNVH